MNEIKLKFSIGELENLTGIKAHTIRIWEKRYGILTPERKESNSRLFTNTELQKLLNISVLIQHGYKISKIAQFSDQDLRELVSALKLDIYNQNQVLQQLKLSMMTYDEILFFETIQKLCNAYSFPVVFNDYILVFLEQIGLLWQTGLIMSSHEHFISNLIRAVILNQTFDLPLIPSNDKPTFVLFTPLGEIHELALLYVQYEIKAKGFKCIYLGTNVPVETLISVNKKYDFCVFFIYNTVVEPIKMMNYLSNLPTMGNSHQNQIWLAGKMDPAIFEAHQSNQIFYIDNIPFFLNKLKKQANK